MIFPADHVIGYHMAQSTSTELLQRLDSGSDSYGSTRNVSIVTSATNQKSFDEEVSDDDR